MRATAAAVALLSLASLAASSAAQAQAYPTKPIRYIISTSADADHVGGNTALKAAGATIAGGNVSGDLGAGASEGAQIVATENVMHRIVIPRKVPSAII